MEDAMTRPMHSWAQEPYAPRHASYSAPENQSTALRLPPPSSLVAGTHSSHSSPNGQDTTHLPSYSTSYPAPSPVRQSPQTPIVGGDPYMPTPNMLAGHPSAQSSPLTERAEPPSEPPRFQGVMGEQNQARPPQPHPQVQRLNTLPPGPASAESMRTQALDQSPADSGPSDSPNQARSPQADGRLPERMKISELLTDQPRRAQERGGKAPVVSPASVRSSATYKMRVRQQPLAARSCGFGERDRRVIDPPPIVQVHIEDPNATKDQIKERLSYPTAVMHCTIWNEAGDADCSTMSDEFRQQRRLMGTVVSTPFVGQDENGEEGCFFTFPDLSCRTPGKFRLQFSLVLLGAAAGPGRKTPVCAMAMSDVFTVFNAKDFPGMLASTPLTKRLKEQGCLISIKKGNERNTSSQAKDDSSDDDQDDDAGPPKRQRRN